MKRAAIGTACIGMALCFISIQSTYAFLSDKGNDSINQFIPGNIVTEIQEEFDSAQTLRNINTSACEIAKSAWVHNSGENACYVRVSVAFSNSDFGASLDGIDTVNWIKDGDYYYYTAILDPGETTSALITKVDVPRVDKYKAVYLENAESLDVIVYEEAVPIQHGNYVFTDYREAWDFHTKNR